MPAYMNDWTNWRWESKKATRSSATDSKVVAEMMDQFTPDSGAPNIPGPTVNGLFSTEKEIAQCQLSQ